MTEDKIILVKEDYSENIDHKQVIELDKALEEKIISEMPLGNDEGLKQLVRDIFQKLKDEIGDKK